MTIFLPETLSGDKQHTVIEIVEALAATPGVAAVVLGGSYARGVARPDSDVDLGVYYDPATPFRIDDIAHIARRVALQPPTVTDFYAWGAWVNGGAWIHTATGKIDLLYRNLAQVERTIGEAEQGIIHHDYPQQPPYGFYSVTYLAETQVCLPLFDPAGMVQALKARVEHYPELLHLHAVNDGLWSAEFTLLQARNFAARGDVYNTVGCLTRTVTTLTQVLFALNRCYFMTDKGALEMIDGFARRPANYRQAICAILAAPGSDVTALVQSVARLEALWQRIVELTDGAYRPKFVM
ncbi:MAG TPA: nucleotidyltransferase domain-containing protein [Chloroflexi bacterium]|nr:nucleotidyltransferase domain-containing protein [Chloroflexota bacterium]